MSDNYELKEQCEIDLVQSWLSDTTEPFDDWDYDGDDLAIILNSEIVEKYSREDIITFIKDFR